jgi:hypothetical protein
MNLKWIQLELNPDYPPELRHGLTDLSRDKAILLPLIKVHPFRSERKKVGQLVLQWNGLSYQNKCHESRQRVCLQNRATSRRCKSLDSTASNCRKRDEMESKKSWSCVSCDITPYSPLKVNRRFGKYVGSSSAFKLVNAGSCLDYFSTLMIQATCSSETSVDFQRNTWR